MTHPQGLPIEERRERDRARYWRDVEAKRAQMRTSRLKYVEVRRAYDRKRYDENPVRHESTITRARVWWKRDAITRGKFNYRVQRRRARIKRATPPWLTAEHKKSIRALYIEAALRDGEWHVDHIYPLNGKNSCGLNVPWNLQILTGDENRKKGNKDVDAAGNWIQPGRNVLAERAVGLT